MKSFAFVTTAAAMMLAAVAPGAAQSKSTKPIAPGDPFPRLEGEFLTGRKAILPDAASGKFALVLMGFTYQSRFSVESWAEHARAAFAQRPGATFFEVPILGGLARLGKWFIDSGMRSGTAKDLHENVITVWGDVDRWKALMAFSDAAQDAAYLALMDQKGRVLWLYRGSYDADAFAAMLKLAGG